MTDQSHNNIFDKKAVYRVPSAAGFVWSEWDDASIVYDPRSGHTQVLNDFARELLALYEDGPKNLNSLYFEFEKIVDQALDENIRQQILEAVSGFDAMGLIEPI